VRKLLYFHTFLLSKIRIYTKLWLKWQIHDVISFTWHYGCITKFDKCILDGKKK
jgi:hypothetical protein